MSRKLPPRSNYFYEQFNTAADRNFSWHPLDVDRFYRFIIAAHRGNAGLNETELERILLDDGFPEDVAKDLSRIYYHGRNILRTPIDFEGWRRHAEDENVF